MLVIWACTYESDVIHTYIYIYRVQRAEAASAEVIWVWAHFGERERELDKLSVWAHVLYV